MIAIYPIKFDSKGLDNKLRLSIVGREMWEYVAIAANDCKLIDKVYMTGIKEDFKWFIENVKPRYNFEWITRPKELTQNGVELLEVMKYCQKQISIKDDYIQLQGTKPLTTSYKLHEIITYFKTNKLNSLFTVQKIETAIGKKTKTDNNFIQYKSDRRSGDEYFKSNAICKIWEHETLKNAELGTWGMGKNHYFYYIDKYHIEVDNIVDYEIARCLIESGTFK